MGRVPLISTGHKRKGAPARGGTQCLISNPWRSKCCGLLSGCKDVALGWNAEFGISSLLVEAETVRVGVVTNSDKNTNHLVLSKCLALSNLIDPSAFLFHLSSKVEISYRQLLGAMTELNKDYSVSRFLLVCLRLCPKSRAHFILKVLPKINRTLVQRETTLRFSLLQILDNAAPPAFE